MSFLSNLFGTKKKEVQNEVLPEKKEEQKPKPIMNYAFSFKYYLNYKNGDKINTLFWSSPLYYDYQKAVADSRTIIEDINDKINHALTQKEKNIFIIDVSINSENFIEAGARDVVLLEFSNATLKRAIDIEVPFGANFIIDVKSKDDDLNKLLEDGVFKIINSKTDW